MQTKVRQKWAAVEARRAGATVREVCIKFEISRATLYRWLGRYDVDKPGGGLQRKKRSVLLRCPHCSAKSLKSALLRIPHVKPSYPPAFQCPSCRGRAPLSAFRGRTRGLNTANLKAVAELAMRYPRWGRRRLWIAAVARGFRQSEATVGRMLAVINKRCPVCRGSNGLHHVGLHHLEADLRWFHR